MNLDDNIKRELRSIAKGIGSLDTNEQQESEEYNDKGWELHCAGKYESAIDYFNKAINLNPRHALAINNKGLSLRRLGKFDEALECFNQAIMTTPDFVKPYSNKGETLGMMGRSQDAKEWFEKALQIDPGYERAKQGLQAYCGREATQEEKDRIERDRKNNREAFYFFVLGAADMSRGFFDDALRMINKALELAPDTDGYLDGKAECLCNMGRFQEALECAKKATELSPEFTSAWVNRAWATTASGSPENGIKYAEEAILLNPKHDMAWNNKGYALLKMKRYLEAIEAFDIAIKINPANPIAKENKKVCLRRQEELSREIELNKIKEQEKLSKEMEFNKVKNLVDCLLSDPDSAVRERAALALGLTRNPVGIPGLIRALEDNVATVALYARNALLEIGSACIVPLIDVLDKKNVQALILAADALGEIGSNQAVDKLIGILDEEEWEVRRSAVEALGKIGNINAVKALKQKKSFWRERNKVVRQTAKRAIIAIRSLPVNKKQKN